jgi:hypothetical protein
MKIIKAWYDFNGLDPVTEYDSNIHSIRYILIDKFRIVQKKFTFLDKSEIALAEKIMETTYNVPALLNSKSDSQYIRRLCEWKIKNLNIPIIPWTNFS